MNQRGFTLIEALIMLFLFSVISMTFYEVISLGTLQIMESKNRLSALSLANKKMEIAHNIPYDALGTKKRNADGSYSYGIPAGDIVQDEDVMINNKNFSVHSFVQFVDDAYDGKISGTTPSDAVPNDYKRLSIEVSWGRKTDAQKVLLTALFIPKGVETTSGGGVFSINVIDSTGKSIPSAGIHITNTNLNPHIDVTTTTDSTGNLLLPGAQASSQSYQIQISKNGYYEVSTYPVYPITAFIPIDAHASVVANALNQKTVVVDKASDITLTAKDVFGAILPNKNFHITGGRKLGDSNAVPSTPVFSLDQDFTSGSDGKKSFLHQSTGSYTVAYLSGSPYQFFHVGTPGSTPAVFSAENGETKNEDIVLIDKEVTALLVTVKASVAGSNPVQYQTLPNASVRLVNTPFAYDTTLSTDAFGQVYFPATLPALVSGSYTYTVSAAGFTDAVGSITITSGLQSKDIVVSPS
jgi:Tfp pilus assembly protein PilV